MTTKTDLTGLGMSPFMADVLGETPTTLTVAGTTVGSASQIPGTQYSTILNTGTSAVKVPKVGGEGPSGGGTLGSQYRVVNLTAATVIVFAAANDLGSVVTFYGSGVSSPGTTGLSLAIGRTAVLEPITVSTWTFYNASIA